MKKTTGIVDLRSDTFTKPTAAMLEAMMTAEVGDDVAGEDTTVNLLQEELASLLGKEAAMFVPSGTMANQIAINLHTRPGDSVICQKDSHCFHSEAGGAAALSGVQPVYVNADEWSDSHILTQKYLDHGIHEATTTLLVIENTHNLSGGVPFDPELLASVCKQAKGFGLATHCDGARLWNASIATNTPLKDLAQGFDTLAVCFSKGLGAPIGSALVGSDKAMDYARKIRKRLGGGMRQAGYMAACARFALQNHVERLADDHRRTRMLYEGLENLRIGNRAFEFKNPESITNMLFFKLAGLDGQRAANELEKDGVKLYHVGDNWLRAVVHLHIEDQDIEFAVKQINQTAKQLMLN